MIFNPEILFFLNLLKEMYKIALSPQVEKYYKNSNEQIAKHLNKAFDEIAI